MSIQSEQFRNAILTAGLEPPKIIEPGKFHRFPGMGKPGRNRAGWCKLFECGTAGSFGDFSVGFSEDWHAERDESLTIADRKTRADQAKKARTEAARQREATYAEAAVRAANEWANATLEQGGHPYLRAKCVKPHGIRTDGTDLLIPLRDGDGAIHSLQRITPDGSKRYLSSGATKGHWFLVGEPTDIIVIGEGFATCATIHEATGHAVAVAFDCGNLEPVAHAVRAKFPNRTLAVAADDDASTEGNPGLTKATALAQAIGARLAIPNFGSHRPDGASDFNDLASARGADAVRACIADAVETTADGAALLDEVRDFIRRFCAFPSEACLDAVTLWAVHAHMVEHFHTTPRLAMLSPEPGSGKTRVLEILDLLVPNSMLVLSPSVAAIFRTLDQQQVTLLFDESDAIFTKRGDDGQNEDLRALINSGYKRGATIPRCVGNRHEVQNFGVFAATALAGLGDLPDTIMSRAVIIRMRKRAPGERVEPFRTRVHEAEGHRLRDRLAEFAAHVGARAGSDWPELPPGIEDRKAEIWEPLIAVADQADGHWPETARRACLKLSAVADNRQASLGIRLLDDIRTVFDGADALPTATILARLCGTEPYTTDGQTEPVYVAEDAPWAELRGKPLDSRALARMLRKYDVASTKVKFGGKSLQGYRRADLWDAWERYLSPAPAKAEPAEPTEPTQQPRGFPASPEVPDNLPVPEPPPKAEPLKPAPHKESSGGSIGSGLPGGGETTSIREVEL